MRLVFRQADAAVMITQPVEMGREAEEFFGRTRHVG
jgi:hypothetical protein